MHTVVNYRYISWAGSQLSSNLHSLHGATRLDFFFLFYRYGQFTSRELELPAQLGSTQLLSQTSKQRMVSAQQRDVTMPMTSPHCRPQSRQLSWVELRRRWELASIVPG